MQKIILFIFTLFFISCNDSTSSNNTNNLTKNKTSNTAINIPSLRGTTNPSDEINHLK